MTRVHVSVPGNGLHIPRIAEVMKKMCEFDRYQDGKLWYRIHYTTPAPPDHPMLKHDGYTVNEAWTFTFPIPLDDGAVGTGAFEVEMRAVTLMRWIRKHIEFLTEAKAEEDGA